MDATANLVDTCAERLGGLYGPAAREWAGHVEQYLSYATETWHVTVGEPIASGYSLLYSSTLEDGRPALLKLAFPRRSEVLREVSVLRAAAGRSMSQLHRFDLDRGLLLLERVRPGRSLVEVAADDDAQATRIAADLLRTMGLELRHEAVPSMLEVVVDFQMYERGYGSDGPVDLTLVDRARTLLVDLWFSGDHRLLHGDLHHGNILQSDRAGWLAIDPKGCSGELACELSAFLINPMDQLLNTPALDALLRSRLQILQESLSVERERLVRWAFVRAVLAEVWNVLDGDPVHGGPMQVAHLLGRQL